MTYGDDKRTDRSICKRALIKQGDGIFDIIAYGVWESATVVRPKILLLQVHAH